MLKKSIAAAIGAVLVAGTAFAQTTDPKVEWSPGGKGDLLIAPMVMTNGGWNSQLKVINHSTTDSAVAKVVFKGPGISEEVLDFLIFLSPGDVWTGTVVRNSDGSVGVASSDSSSILFDSTPGTLCPSTIVKSEFVPTEVKFRTPHDLAYVEIFQSRMIRHATPAPIAKQVVFDAYKAACLQGVQITEDLTDNVLSGSVTLSNAVNGNKLTLPMTALANFNNRRYLSPLAYTGLALASATNGASKAAVEDALWGSGYSFPFNNGNGNLTFGIVTFPTKDTWSPTYNGQYAPLATGGGAVAVNFQVRNEEEELLGVAAPPSCRVSPCDSVIPPSVPRLSNEINVIAVANGGSFANTTGSVVNTQTFSKGWLNVGLTTDVSDTASNSRWNNLGQAGAPALVTYINWDFSGISLQGTWQYATKNFSGIGN